MRIPQGWQIKDMRLTQHENPKFNDMNHYMKLKWNLYGCKQAAHNWFKHLTKGLWKHGFVQSKNRHMSLLAEGLHTSCYVDDCLLFATDSAVIDSLIQDLSTSFLLQDEGDVNAFLGVQISKDPVIKRIRFTLPNLIQQILRNVGLSSSSNGKDTPVDSILYADSSGPDRIDTWNFRSVIGKLNYLANNTRPDISIAMHQCARFCSNPKAIHELAVKRSARYLLNTQNQGLILHPTTDLSLNMFVDADFAGRWHKENSELQDSVLSCTGYVITFCGCPVIWASKLQSEIALSTTESEYIALSTATQYLLPLRRILQDIKELTNVSIIDRIGVSSLPPFKVFEDNNVCIVLATTEMQLKPRTKHISIKYHHFHYQVKNGTLEIVKVATNENITDIFTKPLGKQKFQHLRQSLDLTTCAHHLILQN
jgi:hypothetical protein